MLLGACCREQAGPAPRRLQPPAHLPLAHAPRHCVPTPRHLSNALPHPPTTLFAQKIEPSAAALMYPDCIATPSEFEAVFKSGVGLRNRCVSRDLIGRVGQGDDAAQAIDGGAPSTGGAFIFVSGNDGLEKDLRIAFPDVVGNFVPSHTNPLDGPAFQGLLDISNGQAQLEQIGFPAQFADINATYSFTVFSAVAVRRAVQKGAAPGPNTVGENFGPLSPSWANVVDVYNYAFGKCCGVAIPPAVTQILQTTTFFNLTHCPTECDYVDTRFPGTASVPVVNLPRLDGGACPPSNATFQQTSPSFSDGASPLCIKIYKDAVTAFFDVYGGKDPDCAANKLAAGRLLGTSLAAAGGDALAQAQIVRAFALQGCSGDLNPLNTGNGFTATGFGGLLCVVKLWGGGGAGAGGSGSLMAGWAVVERAAGRWQCARQTRVPTPAPPPPPPLLAALKRRPSSLLPLSRCPTCRPARSARLCTASRASPRSAGRVRPATCDG